MTVIKPGIVLSHNSLNSFQYSLPHDMQHISPHATEVFKALLPLMFRQQNISGLYLTRFHTISSVHSLQANANTEGMSLHSIPTNGCVVDGSKPINAPDLTSRFKCSGS